LKRRFLTFPAIILFFYLFRAIDFFPYETNFNFTSWEKSKLIRWGGMVIIGIVTEEYFIKREKKKKKMS